MNILFSPEIWASVGLLLIGQIARAVSYRNLVSDLKLFRIREILTLNSMGSLFNLIGPYRIGDLARCAYLTKRGLGLKVAIASLILERLLDFWIFVFILALMHSAGLTKLSVWLSLTIAVGLTLVICALLANASSRFREFLSIDSLSVVWRSKVLKFAGGIFFSWVTTIVGLYILNFQYPGLLETWISWNRSFGEPFSPLIARDLTLIVSLVLPLFIIISASQLIKTPGSSIRKVLSRMADNTQNVEIHLKKYSTPFSGSGCEIFTAEVLPQIVTFGNSFLCKIEPRGRTNSLAAQGDFMREYEDIYNFPKVLDSGAISNYNYLIMEKIGGDNQSTSASDFLSLTQNTSDIQRQKLLKELVQFLLNVKGSDTVRLENEFYAELRRAELNSRLQNSLAVVKLHQSASRLSHPQHIQRFSEVVAEVQFLLEKLFTVDSNRPSHGDATLSNFLFQKSESGYKIRALDPNPRVKVGRIEFDLGKIRQSTYTQYENVLNNPQVVSLGITAFREILAADQTAPIFESILVELEQEKKIDIDLVKLFHLTHLIRMIPYKYRDGDTYANFWIEVTNEVFETSFR